MLIQPVGKGFEGKYNKTIKINQFNMWHKIRYCTLVLTKYLLFTGVVYDAFVLRMVDPCAKLIA